MAVPLKVLEEFFANFRASHKAEVRGQRSELEISWNWT